MQPGTTKPMRHGMKYSAGDILLIAFPFTDLKRAKRRPVLVIKGSNDRGDFVCLQITSKATQAFLIPVEDNAIRGKPLPLVSYVKYDKCFTLHSATVDRKLSHVSTEFVSRVEKAFCRNLF